MVGDREEPGRDEPEEKIEKFDEFGQALEGYISLEQARVLAIQHARDNRDFYGGRYAGRDLVWEIASADEGEDYYEIRLSYRPAGRFRGEPGVEQFTIDKTGNIELRQILDEPRATRGVPTLLLAAVGVLIIAGAAGGVLFASGILGGGDEGGAAASAPTPTAQPPAQAAAAAPAIAPPSGEGTRQQAEERMNAVMPEVDARRAEGTLPQGIEAETADISALIARGEYARACEVLNEIAAILAEGGLPLAAARGGPICNSRSEAEAFLREVMPAVDRMKAEQGGLPGPVNDILSREHPEDLVGQQEFQRACEVLEQIRAVLESAPVAEGRTPSRSGSSIRRTALR